MIKYHSFAPTKHILNNLADEFFNRSIGDLVGGDFNNSHPAVNILERANEFAIHLAAPGLEKVDFKIQLEKNQLVVSVKKEKTALAEGEKFTRREFGYTEFRRAFTLPDSIDATAIKASYEQGILSLVLPKLAEKQPSSKTIEIQ